MPKSHILQALVSRGILPTASICSPEELRRDAEDDARKFMGISACSTYISHRIEWTEDYRDLKVGFSVYQFPELASPPEWNEQPLHLAISSLHLLVLGLPPAGPDHLPICMFSPALLRQEAFEKPGALDLFVVMKSLILNVLKGVHWLVLH